MPSATTTFERPRAAWPANVRLFAIALITSVLIAGVSAYPATGNDTLSAPLREYLEKDIGLTGPQMGSVIAGQPVAKLLKTKTKDEVAIFGIVRIHAPQELFIEKLRDIVACGFAHALRIR